MVITIDGPAGTGKSTVATELAYRFGITRVTSTDFVRQTMRAFFSRDFMPSIHQSSFEAGDVYPDADDPLVSGFMQQARNVLVGDRVPAEILCFDRFVANFAGSTDVQRDRSVPAGRFVCASTCDAGFRSVVQPDTQDVCVNEDFEGVPFSRAVIVDRHRVWRAAR